jgi:aspartyl-tRNA(Asn)/glutamyl-tRNA(Gln) amidotransferase subunit C
MKLSREEVRHITTLARLSLTEAETELMQTQLSNILENFEVLRQLDTGDITPTTHSVPLQNVFRQDAVTPSCPREQILSNAPQKEDGYFKVRAVLED